MTLNVAQYLALTDCFLDFAVLGMRDSQINKYAHYKDQKNTRKEILTDFRYFFHHKSIAQLWRFLGLPLLVKDQIVCSLATQNKITVK
jgi:hypothetical protein